MLLAKNEPKLKSPTPLPSLTSTKPDPLGLTPLPIDNRKRYLRFMLSQESNTLLPLDEIVEIVQLALEEIFPVPDMPGCILGVCSWQGETLWLVDLNHLVGYTPLYQQSQLVAPPVVIVVQSAGYSLGLVVEQVSDIDLFEEAKVHMELGLCPLSLEPFVLGFCPQQGGIVLNIASIVNSPLWQSHR